MVEPTDATSSNGGSPRGKYARLPDPVAPEDMIASQDAGPAPYERGEHDSDVDWVLRTVGIG